MDRQGNWISEDAISAITTNFIGVLHPNPYDTVGRDDGDCSSSEAKVNIFVRGFVSAANARLHMNTPTQYLSTTEQQYYQIERQFYSETDLTDHEFHELTATD